MLKKTNEEGNALAGAVFALSFEGEVLDTFTTDAEEKSASMDWCLGNIP